MSSRILSISVGLFASLLCGCSGGGGSAAPSPVGGSYARFLPMHGGDRYEFDSGLVLSIESADEANLGTGAAMRLVFDDGNGPYGLYWSHDPAAGSLMHGLFDRATDRQIVLDSPLPVYWLFANGSAMSEGFGVHTPIGTSMVKERGSLEYSLLDPSISNPIQAGWVWRSSIYGRIYQKELSLFEWRFDTGGVAGRFPRMLSMWSAPNAGPLSIQLDGVTHTTVRAVVDGIVYE